MYLNLKKGPSFNGFGQYRFKLSKTTNVFLDYAGKEVNQVTVNGTVLSAEKVAENWKEARLNLPENLLKVGDNIVTVKFTNNYNTDGNGCHTCTDAEGEQYLYCQTEPYHCNKIMPVFDQPDLKGYMNYFI